MLAGVGRNPGNQVQKTTYGEGGGLTRHEESR